MLDRNFLGYAGLSQGEFLHWVGAAKAELTPFEARLFTLADDADTITGGDNSPYTAAELRELIDIGVVAEDCGMTSRKDFDRAGSIEAEVNYLLDDYNCGALDTLRAALDAIKQAAEEARSDKRYQELTDIADGLKEVIATVENLEKALNS